MKATGISLLAMLAACSIAQAAPITILRQHTIHEIDSDGTWTTESESVVRVDDAQALTSVGNSGVRFSESLQSLKIIEAYTTTRDGVRIDVPSNKMILTLQVPAAVGAPVFSDNKVRNVIFPQMEVGATATLRYQLKQRRPMFPGVVSLVTAFNPFADIGTAEVTLRAPEKMKLQIDAHQVKGGEVKAGRGQREWHWTYSDVKGAIAEQGSLMPEALSAYVAVSTLEGFPQLAEAYMQGAKPAAKVTPTLQKLADEITAGIPDRRLQAEALYRWVSGQIRYVALAMGTGGVVPHKADAVVASRYGDCKDKSTLLIALLQAKAIRAMPVLIHTGPIFELPGAAILNAFNHAITYLPEWDLYVDSTSGIAPFGVLPLELQSKPALLGGDETMKPELRTTPATTAARDRLVMRTVATLASDGTVTGTNSLQTVGSTEPMIRNSFSVPEANRAAMARDLLARSGQNGDASMQVSDARDLTRPLSFTFDFQLPQRVNMPGPGAMATFFGMPPPPSGARNFATDTLRLERKLDFPCPAGISVEETLELALPPEVKITTLPPPSNIESPYGRYTATHEVKDGKLLMARRLDITQARPVCTAADSPELRRFATAISQQLRSQVLYQ